MARQEPTKAPRRKKMIPPKEVRKTGKSWIGKKKRKMGKGPAEHDGRTCGDFGGRHKKTGSPCTKLAGQGMGTMTGMCFRHHPDFLPPRRELFIEQYLGPCNFNATRAYRAVYGQHISDGVAGAMGCTLLKDTRVKRRMQQQLEARAMSKGEILDKYADWGRGSLKYFVKRDGKRLEIDLGSDDAMAHLHLIKKIKETDDGRLEIELISPIEAVNQLAKIHKLTGPEVEVNVTHMTDDELLARIAERRKRLESLTAGVGA